MIAFSPVLPAQQIRLAFQRLDWEKGLSQGTCPYISRDSKGFVWIATPDGLNRFDGQRVRVYRSDQSKAHSLAGNFITSACYEDESTGDLWFTTNGAIQRYVSANDYFDTFQLRDSLGNLLVSDYLGFHLDREGQMWVRVSIGSEGRLHLFNIRTHHDSIVCPLSGARNTVITDRSGAVKQVLSSYYGFNTGGIELTGMAPGFKKQVFFRDNAFSLIREVYVENDTSVWLSMTDGIARFNPRTGASQSFHEGYQGGITASISPYGARLLFVASERNGLWVFDRQTERFIRQFVHEKDNPFSLLFDKTSHLMIDRQENLWVSHGQRGISFVNLRKNKFNMPEAAKDGSFWQFQQGPDGNIWCCEPDSGIYLFSNSMQLVGRIDNYMPELNKRLGFSARLSFLKGTNLAMYSRYLLKWNGNERALHVVQTLPLQPNDIFTTLGGKTILATQSAIFQVDLNADSTVILTPVQLNYVPTPIKSIYSIFCDSHHNLYISDNAERLLVLKETTSGYAFIKSIPGTGNCKSFYEIPGGKGLWVACTEGLLSIGPDLEARILNERNDGVPNATYYGVIQDQQGTLWLTSSQGLLRYNSARKSLVRYAPIDGLFGSEFNTGATYQAPDGTIWAGGIGGLVVFHPDSIRNVPFLPQVQFTRILVNDEALKLSTDQQVETLESLDLPYTQNTLSFEFVALEFSNPEANQFMYRLVGYGNLRGYDNKWIMSRQGFVRYANLPPGEYLLEIRAANSDGVWSGVTKRLVIHIQTPYYKTWWFYLLCLLAIAGLIYAWFRYRLEQALKIERMRVQISSDLHDDVGTLLSGLAMQSEVLELTASEKDKGKLQRIGEISRDAMARMRDTVWAIDARKDKLENLLDRMREHAEETLTPRGIRFDIEADQLNLKQNLPANIRQNVYLIYKEAVTNAAKHTNGDILIVILQKTGAGFEMRIQDNGKVADKTYKTTGLGTSNMQMRAEKIGGKLEISRENGFCVTLRLPGLD
jgi:ligand-binding sensor domain-containing protein/two-component sensor histidine kinase